MSAVPVARRALARTTVTVEAPATTANLGPGFDCLALALDLANTAHVEIIEGHAGSLELVVVGEGVGSLDSSGSDRFSQALRIGLRELGHDPDIHGYRITMHNRIPLSRGLGSSASATVAGLLAADALAGGGIILNNGADPRDVSRQEGNHATLCDV